MRHIQILLAILCYLTQAEYLDQWVDSKNEKLFEQEDIINTLRPFNIHYKTITTNETIETSTGTAIGVRRSVKYHEFSVISREPVVQTWYHLPYGTAKGRWQDPIDYPKWEGPQDFTKYNSKLTCYRKYFGYQGNESDCLRLSLHKPYETRNSNKTYPLMIWVHGGSYNGGEGMNPIFPTSNNMLYDPMVLVDEGVIVANIDYRLQSLGGGDFNDFSTTNDNLPNGNYHIKDMIKAVDYLIENADNFGIDKDRITVFGQSAGGSLSSWAAALKNLEGKIHNVIPSSGNLMMSWGSRNKTGSNGNAVRALASKIHCTFPDAESVHNCLLLKPSEDIISYSRTNLTWRPIVDKGQTIDIQDPIKQFEKYSKNVNVMVGSVAGDANPFELAFPGAHGLENFIEAAITDFSITPWNDRNYWKYVCLHFGRYWQQTTVDPTKYESYRRGEHQALQSWIFVTGSHMYADVHAKLNGIGKTFLYSNNLPFALEPLLRQLDRNDRIPYCNDLYENNNTTQDPTLCGAMHGEDIFYFMGHLQMRSSELPIIRDAKSKAAIETSKRMVTAWANFAKFGDPQGKDFKEYTAEDPKLIKFNLAESSNNRQPNVDTVVDVDSGNWGQYL